MTTGRTSGRWRVIAGVAVCCLAAAALSNAQSQRAETPSWSPPIGIPSPEFGVSEVAPPFPTPWTRAHEKFYYVSPSAPEATDVDNANGWPGRPRQTIPIRLEPGAVVQVVGTYTTPHDSDRAAIQANGTASAPVFVRGSSSALRPTFTRGLHFRGTYFIVEYITSDVARDETNIAVVPKPDGPSRHVVIRHSEVIGDPMQFTSAGVGAGGFDESRSVEDVVFFDLTVHDQGNPQAPRDVDAHCTVTGPYVQRFWLIDSRLHDCAGDGFQANPGQGGAALARQRSAHHIYVGRNTAYNNKQSGLWAKNVSDIVFSQNTIYGIARSASSPLGQCMGGQYGPVRMWIIFNTLHDCETGVMVASTSGLGVGTDVYIVGNVIYDIKLTGGPNDAANAWSRAAIALWDIPNRFIVDNTIWRVHSGIKNDGSGLARIVVQGNIIDAAADARERDLWVPDQGGFNEGASKVVNNLFVGNRIAWRSSERESSSQFRSQTGKRPRFVDQSKQNFRYAAADSPGVDASAESEVYQVFEKTYGLNIRVDHEGRPRPQGRAWDVGAYEWR